MGRARKRVLSVCVVAMCAWQLVFSASAAGYAKNIAVANNGVVYVRSDTDNVVLTITCFPGERVPTVPEAYRDAIAELRARAEPIISLGGLGAGSGTNFEEVGSEFHLEVLLDGQDMSPTDWSFQAMRTTTGGYSLSVRGKPAATLLAQLVAARTLVMKTRVLEETQRVAFDLQGLEQVVARAVTCVPSATNGHHGPNLPSHLDG